ncbi:MULTISPECIES: Lrp/AsnC family transcriptional regulator [Cohaesibacter]|uniref:Lrp/AsnC family transcriptional regulator n=1 Tax=Cohaesibacter TaxID=655352 RepID=UPI000DEB3872|nr:MULTISPECIES: Lrp/AsnC family transcriptional regulator [Cohaesibacter]TLP45493.1 Lrp/AsnC family transcriptional regulator [Cohaesibacter sp. CAU 1516]
MNLKDLDKRDRSILNLLQDNGRLSNAELAEAVNLSPSACLRRVRQLEESGLIAGYAMQLNMKACGMTGTAFVFVTLDGQGRETLDRFERAIKQISVIQDCYLLAGQYDYLLRIIYRDSADLERIHHDILTNLPGVVRVNSTLTLRAVKHTGKLEV